MEVHFCRDRHIIRLSDILCLEHIYECRAPEEEAEDLTCWNCFPGGENGQYNCSCWIDPPEELEDGTVYLTCQDAYTQGETESGTYTLKPDHLSAFKVK